MSQRIELKPDKKVKEVSKKVKVKYTICAIFIIMYCTVLYRVKNRPMWRLNHLFAL